MIAGSGGGTGLGRWGWLACGSGWAARAAPGGADDATVPDAGGGGTVRGVVANGIEDPGRAGGSR